MLEAASTLGNKSQDCSQPICYDTCAPCEHKQYVFDQSEPFNGLAPNLVALTEAVLDVHDAYIAELCNLELDICKRGELAGFPCVQCGFIDPSCVTYGDPLFLPTVCAECPCFRPLDFSQCNQVSVDLSVVVPDIYARIILALEQLSGRYANGGTLADFFLAFLPQSNLLFFKDSTYHFSLGSSDSQVLSILPLLISLAPVPIGTKVQFYINCDSVEVAD